jgi:hypothetical protein
VERLKAVGTIGWYLFEENAVVTVDDKPKVDGTLGYGFQ